MDTLTDADVTLLHQAIAYRRATRLAKAIYSISNVMGCIKALMLEHTDQSSGVTSLFLADDVKLENSPMAAAETSQHQAKSTSFISESDTMVEDGSVTSNETMPSESVESTQSGQYETVTIPSKSSPRGKSRSASAQSKDKTPGKRKALPKQAAVKSEAMFTCEICGYQTKRKDHFKRHGLSHTDIRPVRCSLCSYSCMDKHHLIRHLNSSVHKQKKKMGEMKCDTCDYTTNHANRMLRHTRIHSGEKPFACKYCSYKAAQKATLDRHILTHTGEKPFRCEKCEYCAADTKSLRFHTLQKHGGDDGTVHKCPQCEYSTPVLRYYKLHMRAHSDARPYLCDICGYSSKRPHGLTKHYRAVHGWSKSDTDGKEWRRAPSEVEKINSPTLADPSSQINLSSDVNDVSPSTHLTSDVNDVQPSTHLSSAVSNVPPLTHLSSDVNDVPPSIHLSSNVSEISQRNLPTTVSNTSSSSDLSTHLNNRGHGPETMAVPHMGQSDIHIEFNVDDRKTKNLFKHNPISTSNKQQSSGLIIGAEMHCSDTTEPSGSFTLPTTAISANDCDSGFLSSTMGGSDSAADNYLQVVLSEMAASTLSADTESEVRDREFY